MQLIQLHVRGSCRPVATALAKCEFRERSKSGSQSGSELAAVSGAYGCGKPEGGWPGLGSTIRPAPRRELDPL